MRPRGWHLLPTPAQEQKIIDLSEELGRAARIPDTRGEARSMIAELRQARDRRKGV